MSDCNTGEETIPKNCVLLLTNGTAKMTSQEQSLPLLELSSGNKCTGYSLLSSEDDIGMFYPDLFKPEEEHNRWASRFYQFYRGHVVQFRGPCLLVNEAGLASLEWWQTLKERLKSKI